MKVKLNIVLAIIICLMLIIISGCGGKKTGNGETSNKTGSEENIVYDLEPGESVAPVKTEDGRIKSVLSVPDEKYLYFAKSSINIEDIEGYLIRNVTVNDDKLYFLTEASSVDENNKTRMSFYLYEADMQGGKASRIETGIPFGNYLFFETNGTNFVLISKNVDGKYSDGAFIVECDRNKGIKETKVEELLGVRNDEIKDITWDYNGKIYVAYTFAKEIVCFNNGTESFGIDTNAQILGLKASKNGEVYVLLREEKDVVLKRINTEKNSLEEVMITHSDFNQNVNIYSGEGKYDFYYSNTEGIYGLDVEGKKEEKIVDLKSSGFSINDISTFSIVDQNRIVGVDYSSYIAGKKAKIDIYERKTDDIKEDNRKVLRVYGLSDAALRQFNLSGKEYRLEGMTVPEDVDPMSYLGKEIAAGRGPDIYYLGGNGIGNMSLEFCISKGMFADISPFYESDDIIKSEDMLPGISEALKIDGKIYFTAGSFTLTDIYALNSSVTGRLDVLDYNTIKELAKIKNGIETLNYIAPHGSSGAEGLFEALFRPEDFVDIKDGKNNFTDGRFKEILEFCKEYGEIIESLRGQESEKNFITYVSEECSGFVFADDAYGNDTQVLHYGGNGVKIRLMDVCAISSGCKDKEFAWEVIKSSLSEASQNTYNHSYPIRKKSFDSMIKRFKGINEGVEGFEEIANMPGFIDNPMSDREEKELRHIIENIDGIYFYNPVINEIIREDVNAYFAGEKTAEETCRIIDSRVTIFLNEQR